ncbi:hypothetical protein C8Q79DRAFT_1099953, partial [Trametes meyenii]
QNSECKLKCNACDSDTTAAVASVVFRLYYLEYTTERRRSQSLSAYIGCFPIPHEPHHPTSPLIIYSSHTLFGEPFSVLIYCPSQ